MNSLIRKCLNLITFSALAVILLSPTMVSAEAYCALRDPVTSIKQLFPQSTGHRSIVRTIDEQTRQQVLQQLPKLPLHFGELGRHTLYVALEGVTPVGLVHVRSEQSSTGLVEIAWALNMDLTIRDFVFQRCRSRQKKVLEQADFKVQFMGQALADIRGFYDEGTNQGTSAYLDSAGRSKALANVVLKCAMKTLVVTSLAWEGDLVKMAYLNMLESQSLADNNLIPIPVLPDKVTLSRLEDIIGVNGIGVDRHTVSGFLVQDEGKNLKALLYLSRAQIDDTQLKISWLFDINGEILGVESRPDWPSEEIKNLFEQTQQQHFTGPEQCSNRAELYALEGTLIMQPYFLDDR